MKKILFLTAFPPNKNTGGGKNTLGILDQLSTSHNVDIIYWQAAKDDAVTLNNENIQVKKVFTLTKTKKIFNVLTLIIINRFFSIRFSLFDLFKIRGIVSDEKYDLIIFDHSQIFLYGWFLDKSVSKAFIALDIITQRASRSVKYIFPIHTFISEYIILKAPGVNLFTLNKKDVDLTWRWFGKRMDVINVPIDRYIRELGRPNYVDRNFNMFGNWKRLDNMSGLKWLISDVLEHVKEPLKIDVYGIMEEFTDSIIINQVEVRFHGFVENPYDAIASSRGMIVPLFTGAGVKIKVIESLACGCPVIGTDIAFEGVPVDNHRFIFKANSKEDFIRVLNNDSELDISLQERENFKRNFLNSYMSGIEHLVYGRG